MSQPIIQLSGVTQHFKDPGGGLLRPRLVRALDGVDIEVHPNRTLAIVGESGSGKSTLAKLLLLLRRPTSGEIRYRGVAHSSLGRAEMKKFRREVQAVFQDPAASLNPRMTIEESLGHVARFHRLAPPAEMRAFLSRHLEDVGLSREEDFLPRFPHQLSGGQQQRVAIARAMMLSPAAIIADEPLSSLDVSIQAQILDLMLELRTRTGIGLVIVSHDLGAMKSIADEVAVMYRGKVVEFGEHVFDDPQHPYTRLLLDSQLSMDPRNRRPIRSLEESGESSGALPLSAAGCSFQFRCDLSQEVCARSAPRAIQHGDGGPIVRCHVVNNQERADT
ncbi:MAG: ABC transporter ATP-binding protein [Paracoccaceae bacterium]